MSTFTQIRYHLVFATKDRRPVLSESRRSELYKYVSGIIKNKGCRLILINGVENHVHVLFSLHPAVALADMVKDIKVASSIWIKENNIFPNFMSWQEGYGAFTYSLEGEPDLVAYVQNQEEHHRKF